MGQYQQLLIQSNSKYKIVAVQLEPLFFFRAEVSGSTIPQLYVVTKTSSRDARSSKKGNHHLPERCVHIPHKTHAVE